MRYLRIALVLFFVVLLFVSCSRKTFLPSAAAPLGRLRQELDTLFAQPDFFNAHWGVAVQSLRTGELIYARNLDKGFMPASNMKLFTTALALSELGPEYRYHTKVFRTGAIRADGTLDGDLVIVGSGDPSLGGRYNGGKILAQFEAWADSLKRAGIRKIAGRIIGDDNLFADEIMGRGWSWDYQSDWYAAQISALSFNDNCIDIIFSAADTAGGEVSYRLEPPTRYARILNNVRTVPPGQEKGIFYYRRRGTNQVRIEGTLPAGTMDRRDWFSIENPTAFAAYVFREILEREGIGVAGEAADIDSLQSPGYSRADSLLLVEHVSPPLWQICETINKRSQNLYAELVFRTVGLHKSGLGSFESGLEAMKSFLSRIGINPETMGIADASGLSRLNLVSPRQVITLLRYMRTHPRLGTRYYSSLPVAGEDGTLQYRMRETAAARNVHAKTGYIGRVRALSGFVTTADGEELVFSMIANNYTVPTSLANKLQDSVCERLANFSRRDMGFSLVQ